MTKLRTWRLLISALVVLLLLVNGLVIFTLLRVRSRMEETIITARNALATTAAESLVFDVSVDQPIPIRADVPIDQVFEVPLVFAYPLETVVNTYVDIPLLGRQDIALPIETVIPISYTIAIPVQVSVPISVTYRLQTEIPVEVALPPDLLQSLDALLGDLAQELETPLK